MKNFEKRLEALNGMKILSFDAESNGLWGEAFAIGAIVYNASGKEIDRFLGRSPLENEIDSYVKENVLPNMTNIKVTHKNYKSLLKDFFEFMSRHKDAKVLCHMGHVVEAKLLQDAYKMGMIRPYPHSDAPYEWFDVCILFGDSVDRYNRENKIFVEEGNVHNPIYDSIAAYRAFKHFIQNS